MNLGLNLEQLLHEVISNAIATAMRPLVDRIELAESKGEGEILLDVEEAAAFLKVTTATVHAWKRSGKLPYRKLGDRTLFLKSELISSLKKPELPRRKRK